MKPSDWKAPEPTTVSSAILFHCATVFPGGNAAAASRVVPAPDAAASAVTATTTPSTRALIIPPPGLFPLVASTLALGPLRGRCSALRTSSRRLDAERAVRRALEFRVLGPVEVVLDGEVMRIGSPTQRTLLALLLMHANEVVSTDRIVDV